MCKKKKNGEYRGKYIIIYYTFKTRNTVVDKSSTPNSGQVIGYSKHNESYLRCILYTSISVGSVNKIYFCYDYGYCYSIGTLYHNNKICVCCENLNQ